MEGNRMSEPFWKRKSFEQMSQDEWESLCDGCARCCLNKLEDWDTGEIYWTEIACSLLNIHSCRCSDYDNRASLMPDCIQLTPEKIKTLTWLPPTCGYRLVLEGKDLPHWHPLISGTQKSVHDAGISVRARAIPEKNHTPQDFENHIVSWPAEEE